VVARQFQQSQPVISLCPSHHCVPGKQGEPHTVLAGSRGSVGSSSVIPKCAAGLAQGMLNERRLIHFFVSFLCGSKAAI
jgi:hypothetical protein